MQAANAAGHIQARLGLDAERLQVDALLETADQHIGANSDSHGGFSRSTSIGTLQGALVDLAWRKNGPCQNRTFGKPISTPSLPIEPE